MGNPPPHYRVLIPASSLVSAPAPVSQYLLCKHDALLPLHDLGHEIRGFGDRLLSPDHFRRRSTRLVSYYALFKGMAASKPTSQLSEQIHILCFSTESALGDLSRRSGFLPSRSRTLSHGSCLPGFIKQVFGVCLDLVGFETPASMQCSTPC